MKKYVLLITFLVVLATSSAYANDLYVAIGDGAYYGALTHSIVRIEVAMVTGTLNTMSDTQRGDADGTGAKGDSTRRADCSC